MKKVTVFILISAICFGLAACGAAPAEPATRDETMPKKLLVSDLTSIPLATASMTKDELRQLCLDFFELQLSFQWTPGMDVEFLTTNYKKGTLKQLKTDAVYGGIIYQSKGTGNLYRWLEYYDEATGIFDFETALAANGGYGEAAAIFDAETDENGNISYKKYRSLMTLFNQCSASSFWGWSRVINSVRGGWTCDMTACNGYIPVGCYDYGYEYEGQYYGMTDIKSFGKDGQAEGMGNPKGYDTVDVIADLTHERGQNAIFDCYTLCKPADLLVDDGHVLMVKSVNLYKSQDGEIVYDMSSITVLEQIEAWGNEGTLGEKEYKLQGGVDKIYSFKWLQENGYIPFTFAELLDENDPQDKEHLDYYLSYADKLTALKEKYSAFEFTDDMNGIDVEKSRVFATAENGPITLTDFENMTVGSNYTVSDVFVTVKDPSGNVLLTNIYRAGYPDVREVSMRAQKSTWEQDADGNYLTICNGLNDLADGKNTVEVALQISTGEKLVAFQGTISK